MAGPRRQPTLRSGHQTPGHACQSPATAPHHTHSKQIKSFIDEYSLFPLRRAVTVSKCSQDLREELQGRQVQQASLQALWCQLQPEDEAEESNEAREKLHVTGSKLKLLLRQVEQDLSALQQRLVRV